MSRYIEREDRDVQSFRTPAPMPPEPPAPKLTWLGKLSRAWLALLGLALVSGAAYLGRLRRSDRRRDSGQRLAPLSDRLPERADVHRRDRRRDGAR